MFFKQMLKLFLSYLILTILYCPDYCTAQESGCEVQRRDCVCDLMTAIEELTNLVARSGQMGPGLEHQIRNYKCSSFKRLPPTLRIEASELPLLNTRVIYRTNRFRRVKRQITLGVPTNELFEKAIAHVSPGDAVQYAILGTAATFPCRDDSGRNAYETEDFETVKRFTWTHYDGTPVTASQTSVDPRTGTLTFRSVQLTDIDVYNCTMESDNPNYAEIIVQKFVHQLFVISEPLFWLKMNAVYQTQICRKEVAELIRGHFAHWITTNICPMCKVHNATVGCSQHSQDRQGGSPRYTVGLAISAIGLELRLQQMPTCPVTCLEAIHIQIMEVVRNSAEKLSFLPIEISNGDGSGGIIHEPIANAFELHLKSGCLGGFSLSNKLCFPCIPGTYSPEDSADCYPCEVGFYQDSMGSSYCKPCGQDLSTFGTGSSSDAKCLNAAELLALRGGSVIIHYIWTSVVVFVLLLILIILILIRCCCPGSSIGGFVNRFCCCCCPWKGYTKLDEDSARIKTSPAVKTKSNAPSVKYSKKVKQLEYATTDGESTPPARHRSQSRKHREEKSTEKVVKVKSPTPTRKEIPKTNFSTAVSSRASKTQLEHSSTIRRNSNEKLNSSSKIRFAQPPGYGKNAKQTDSEENCIDDDDDESTGSNNSMKTQSGQKIHRCFKPNPVKLKIEEAARKQRSQTRRIFSSSSEDEIVNTKAKNASKTNVPPIKMSKTNLPVKLSKTSVPVKMLKPPKPPPMPNTVY